MDSLDKRALGRLMRDGRATWADLASDLELSPAAAAERVRRLERAGAIKGYAAVVDPGALGLALTAYISVTLKPDARAQFLAAVSEVDSIVECHHVTGDHDYLLKVRCAGTSELDEMLNVALKQNGGVHMTRTLIVLSTAKDTMALPVD